MADRNNRRLQRASTRKSIVSPMHTTTKINTGGKRLAFSTGPPDAMPEIAETDRAVWSLALKLVASAEGREE